MTVELMKHISAEVFKTMLLASGPVLLVSLLVGVIISFIQAITQLQEFTITFVPKIIAVFLCLLFFMPWISNVLIDFTRNIINNIPAYIK
ncbi:MAG: flagellar biosynthetic protein FliQ [Nitrospirae bacterium]|nr:MAG: flagellar biosynthetic protein FliQ [Nitrospirota bacterium]